MISEYTLEIKNISKSFPGVKALSHVDLKIRNGTVHALMGENGAGKSTLMKILYGIYKKDEGEIHFMGKPFSANSPIEAIRSGISMIPQEISPVPNLDVASNIFLGKEYLRKGPFKFLDQRKIYNETAKLFEELNINLEPGLMMSDISIANAQLVAIAAAVSYKSDLIIMDEPTSALTEKEVKHLFSIIRDLRENKNVAIIYISHKLDEIFSVCDEVSVIRDGQSICSDSIENMNKDKLISMMVGRSIEEFFHKIPAEIGKVLLEIKNLSAQGKVKDVSFKIHRGEILGIAGLMGAGRTELMEAIFGYIKPDAGGIYINGKKVDIRTPHDAIKNRLGFVTEDRKYTGIFQELSLTDNMIMPDVPSYLKGGFLNFKRIINMCGKQREALDIKTPGLDQLIKNLSGGNQQKVLMSRWLLMEPDILILDEPTRGIDVGAKAGIHRLICELAAMGKAIIMVSSEMPEILSMSDRIIVMHEGEFAGELSQSEATQEKVLQLATGESL